MHFRHFPHTRLSWPRWQDQPQCYRKTLALPAYWRSVGFSGRIHPTRLVRGDKRRERPSASSATTRCDGGQGGRFVEGARSNGESSRSVVSGNQWIGRLDPESLGQSEDVLEVRSSAERRSPREARLLLTRLRSGLSLAEASARWAVSMVGCQTLRSRCDGAPAPRVSKHCAGRPT